MSTEKNQVAKIQPTQAERFTSAVTKQFTSNIGNLELTKFQERLIQNYFVVIDGVLKKAESNRLSKSEQYRDALPVTWANINMDQLALDVVGYSLVGFDPAQSNHINMIPYKNNKASKYDLTPIIGYRGKELKAKKFGLDVPDAITIEVVYKNDIFKPVKKDANHTSESYTFEIPEAFNRGDIVGGFYFHQFKDATKNKLVLFSLEAILKRKPKYASAEFWGGEKDVWVNKKRTGEKEKIEGWFDQMCWKTIARAAYEDITIDSQKIDDNFMSVLAAEKRANELQDFEPKTKEIQDFEPAVIIEDGPKEEEKTMPQPEEEKTIPSAPQQTTIDPGF